MEIYTLKVNSRSAGTSFPFDRVYLVKYKDRAYLKKLFRYALVMPVDSRLREMLQQEVPSKYVDHAMVRNDDNKETPPTVDEWAAFLGSEPWVMAVPIVTKWATKNMPRYLVSSRWYSQSKHTRKEVRPEPLSNLTYLQTPEKNIRPVCVACPRFILHQNGECKVGDNVCYESLSLGINDYFKSGLNAPAPQINIKDEVENVLLQEHDAGTD